MKKFLALLLCLLLVVPQSAVSIFAVEYVEEAPVEDEVVTPGDVVVTPEVAQKNIVSIKQYAPLTLTYGIDSTYYTASMGDGNNIAYCYFPLEEYGDVLQLEVTYEDKTTAVITVEELPNYHSDYWFESNQSYENEWVPGTHTAQLWRNGEMVCDIEVEILDTPVSRIEMNETRCLTMGIDNHYQSYGYYDENDNWIEVEYPAFDQFEAVVSYYVYYKDGTIEFVEFNSYEFGSYGVTCQEGYNNQWTPGNTYTATFETMGVSVDYEIEILENPVASVELVLDGDLREYIDGTWDNVGVYDEVTGEYGYAEYYYYYVDAIIDHAVIYYTDGRVENMQLNEFYEYWTLITDQDYYNQWTVGNTYSAIFRAYGHDYNFEVSVVPNGITHIEIGGNFDIVEGTYGYELYDDNRDEYYHYYDYHQFMDSSGYVCYEDGTRGIVERWQLKLDFVQDGNNRWTVGNSYPIYVTYGGVTTTFYVNIIESNVKYVEFIGNNQLWENVDGWYDWYYDENGDKIDYFNYSVDGWIDTVIVYYKDGTVQSFEYTGEYNDHLTIHDPQRYDAWSVGNSYEVEFEYDGYKSSFWVEIIENPVERIEIDGNFEIVENSNGYLTGYYDENDNYLQYYKYDVRYLISGVYVYYNDGSCEYLEAWEAYNNGMYYEDNQSYYNAWYAGNSYDVVYNYFDVECVVSYSIVETNIERFELYGRFEVLEESQGRWDSYYDENGEEHSYFFYNTKVFDYGIVWYKDGTSEELHYPELNNVSVNFIQDENNQWTVGNSYPVTANYKGVEYTYYIHILENPVASIEIIFNPDVYEYTGGWWNSGYDENGEYQEHLYYNYHDTGVIEYVIVNYKDGTSAQLRLQDLGRYGIGCEGEWQSYDNQWTVGNSYGMYIEYAGCEGEYYVSILPDPVEKIEVFGQFDVEPYTRGGYHMHTDSDGVETIYYRYYYSDMIDFVRVYYNDGSYEDVYHSDLDEYYFSNVNQDFDNQWMPGNSYPVTFGYRGHECTYYVNILESNIQSVEVIGNFDIVENTNGYWDYDYDGEGNRVDFFRYWIEDCIECFIVTYKDGTVEEFDRWEFDWNTLETPAQNAYSQMTVGNSYDVVCMYKGCMFTYTLNIVETNIERIEVLGDFTFIENSNGDYREEYDHETGEYVKYYRYNLRNRIDEIVLYYKDGTVERYDRWSLNFNIDYNQSYDNQWTAGNSYEFEISYNGATAVCTATIVESPVASIEVLGDFDVVEYTTGCWDSYLDENDVEQQYYWYYVVDVIDYVVVNYKDGTSEMLRRWELGDYTTSFDQGYHNQWTVGNGYDVEFNYAGVTYTYTINIIENPVAAYEIYESTPLVYGNDSDTYWGENGEPYEYFYVANAIVSIKIINKDGTEEIVSRYDFDGSISNLPSGQSYETPWTPGNTYTAQVYIDGFLVEFPVDIVEPEEFDYIVENGGAYIIGWSEYNSETHTEDVVIPTELHGIPVVGIYYMGDRALPYNSVTIPDCVTYIEDYAFSPCEGLKTVNIGSGADQISWCAFAECYDLENIFVSEDNPYYCDVNGVLFDKDVTILCGYPVAKGDTYYLPATVEDFSIKVIYPEVNFILDPNSEAFVVEDGVTYNKDKTQIIFADKTVSGDYVMPETVEEIYANAFMECTKLESVVFSPNVANISYAAFDRCTSLKSVTLPDELLYIDTYAFSECSSLESIELPGKLEYIGDYAFFATGLKSLNVPGNVIAIWDRAFAESALETVTIEGGTEYLARECFARNEALTKVTLGEGLMELGAYCFANCTSLVSINVPDTLMWMSSGVFSGCSALTYVPVGNEMSELPEHYMQGCTSLETADIPDNIQGVYDYAFSDCSSLKQVNIPNSVNYMGEGVFASCTSLEYVPAIRNMKYIPAEYMSGCTALKVADIPATVTDIYESAFSGCTALSELNLSDKLEMIGNRAFSGCTSLAEVKLPYSVNSLGKECFSGCTSLESINLENVESIGEGAFNVTNLKNVNFSEKITYIDKYTFANSALESITIPSNVTDIAYFAFYNCENLSEIVMPETLVRMDGHVFENTAWLNAQPEGEVYLGTSLYQYKGDITEETTIYLMEGIMGIASHAFESECNRYRPWYYENEPVYNRSGLKAVYIPASVEWIGSGVFCGCAALETIYFGGSEEQWANLIADKNNETDSELLNCNVIYNYVVGGDVVNTVVIDGVEQRLNVGETVSIPVTKITIDSVSGKAYVFEGWNVEGVEYEISDDNTLTFVMPANEVVITTDRFIHGDVSRDGSISALDVFVLLNSIKHGAASASLDINMDGKVTASDKLALMKVIKGIYEY